MTSATGEARKRREIGRERQGEERADGGGETKGGEEKERRKKRREVMGERGEKL